MKILDVTRPVISNMTVWPGDEGALLERTASISRGSMVNVSRVHMGVHTGTHVDAPLHFIDGGKSIDELDVQLFTGWVRVVDVRHEKSIQPEQICSLPGEKNEAVFFRTSYSEKTLEEPFDTEFTGLSFEAASFLLAQGVRVIGTDALSIEAYNSKDFPVHYALLGNEVLIVEGLCLKGVAPGRYRYVCMPLLLKGSDGSPARVVLFDDANENEEI
ncbi:MAG: cyclase family protein [Ruminiclostridium sp.]|nr:cyclase family protein [Ruminiclostridium sp.]